MKVCFHSFLILTPWRQAVSLHVPGTFILRGSKHWIGGCVYLISRREKCDASVGNRIPIPVKEVGFEVWISSSVGLLWTCVRVCVCVCVWIGAWVGGRVHSRVALLIQHTTLMRHIVSSSAASLALPHFSALSRKRHDFRGKTIEYRMCVLILSTTFIWNISHYKNDLLRYCHKCEKVFM